ncbi:hypothetical protein RchiOBHm_Chr5g0056461 [Rosa chinensis]|uniref:Uncharacterized protein n=1 Tax=Rosa chinensis TaxID=74649 RepID=A0A2P6QGN1_ROSCH|nr:hypothetical protein RchiOBHm_Chr5g0056461 [Rosa chinensis]
MMKNKLASSTTLFVQSKLEIEADEEQEVQLLQKYYCIPFSPITENHPYYLTITHLHTHLMSFLGGFGVAPFLGHSGSAPE